MLFFFELIILILLILKIIILFVCIFIRIELDTLLKDIQIFYTFSIIF